MHTHEKWENGKRILDEVRACVCLEKSGDQYEVECRIHQRGVHQYLTTRQAEKIVRDGTKVWVLTDEAKKPVKNAIRRFENRIARIESGDPFKAVLGETGILVLFRRRSRQKYESITRHASGKVALTGWMMNKKVWSIGDLIRTVSRSLGLHGTEGEMRSLLWETTAETLQDNPFYRAAQAKKDEALAREIRLFYHSETEEDIRELAKLLRRRVLPSLGKEYDKTYTVPVREMDFNLLFRSGYQFLHRPYFSMKGFTHSLCELNPHTKTGVDAGRKDVTQTCFKDYLALFRAKKKKSRLK